eukprot:scaffold61170_cov45-Phaeocystis_antarctica.AAC.2
MQLQQQRLQQQHRQRRQRARAAAAGALPENRANRPSPNPSPNFNQVRRLGPTLPLAPALAEPVRAQRPRARKQRPPGIYAPPLAHGLGRRSFGRAPQRRAVRGLRTRCLRAP